MTINNTITKEEMLWSFMNFSQLAVDVVGALYSHFALPMLLCKIWWVNCDKEHWEDEEKGQKWKKKKKKKTALGGSVPTIFV